MHVKKKPYQIHIHINKIQIHKTTEIMRTILLVEIVSGKWQGWRQKEKQYLRCDSWKSRTNERREVWEIITLGQEAWFTNPKVIRCALAQDLLKKAKGHFSFNNKQGKSGEPNRSKRQLNLMQRRRGGCWVYSIWTQNRSSG